MTALIAGVLLSLWVQTVAPQPTTDEETLRALVQQYYAALEKKDPDAALAFWSTSASPRPTRESFVMSFGTGEDTYTVDVQSVKISDAEARVRVVAVRTRQIVRNGVTLTPFPMTLQSAQLWRREGPTWKLARDGPFAEDFADALMAATPDEQARLMAENPTELTPSLRRVLGDRASMAAIGQNYARARTIFELVLAMARATHDQRAESESLQNIANAYYYMRDYAAATDLYQRRLALSKEMDDPEATAASLVGLATVAYVRGEYTPALASYREALDIYEKRDEGTSIGRTLVSVGNIQYLQADYDVAAPSYRRAIDLLTDGRDTQGASLAKGGLARVFAAQGDIVAAIEMYGRVLDDARSQLSADPRMASGVSTTLESIGELYFRLGNVDRARSSFDEARKMSDADPESAGRLYANLGLVELVAGRFDVALADYTSSRTRYEQAKSPEGVAHAWVGIGFSQAAKEKFSDAIAAYRTAIKMFEAQHKDEDAARAWLGLSLAQSGSGDNGAALDSAKTVGTIADRIKSVDLAWRSNVRAGEALRKLSRLDEARRAFETAIATIDPLAADAPTSPETRRQLDESASAWAGLALTLASQSDAPGALAAAEGRLAHLRRVQFAGFQRDIVRGATREEQDEEQNIVRELIPMRAQVRAEHNAPRPDPARVQRLEQQLAALVAKRADQQARLYARLPELREWRGLEPPAAAAHVNSLVPDARTMLVEYLLSDDDLLVISIAHGETAAEIAAAVVPTTRRALADLIGQAMQPSVLADPAAWRTKSAPIAKVLIDPVASRLADRDRLVILPDDLLWKVPFEALPLGDADLAAAATVTYATSIAALAVERAIVPSPADPNRPQAAIVAAPVIPAAIRAQLALARDGWKEPDPAASRTLAESLAKPFADPATVRTGADATEAASRTLLETSDVLFLSAPLQVNAPVPLFSSFLLGGDSAVPVAAPVSETKPAGSLDARPTSASDAGTSAARNTTVASIDTNNDGRWEAREWFGATARAKVVIAPDGSSFGAGAGPAMDALAWAAAAAGIPSLVLGRWPADGFTSEALLTAFDEQLAKGASPVDAWAAAVTATRKDATGPAAWAGLRLIGR